LETKPPPTNSGSAAINYEELIHYFNNLSSPFAILDNSNSKFIYCNGKFIKLSGFNEEECYKHTFNDFKNWIHPDDLYTLENNVGKHLRELNSNFSDTIFSAHKINFQFNFRLKEKDKNGKNISLLAQSTILEWDDQNKPKILLILLSDITDYTYYNKIVFSIKLFNNEDRQWISVFQEDFLIRPQMLSERENEVFSYIVQDHSASEISKILNISFFTVRTHWRNILSKTGCKAQKELKLLAQKNGWI
jgi:DNA-binding CsgD family transcriptional regulator